MHFSSSINMTNTQTPVRLNYVFRPWHNWVLQTTERLIHLWRKTWIFIKTKILKNMACLSIPSFLYKLRDFRTSYKLELSYTHKYFQCGQLAARLRMCNRVFPSRIQPLLWNLVWDSYNERGPRLISFPII